MLYALLVLWGCSPTPVQQTTFYLVRHAEKAAGTGDVDLSSLGMARANDLAFILENIPLDAIYATQYLRTQQTVEATATAQNMKVSQYHASTDSIAIKTFLDRVLKAHTGGEVLISGHSNTIPLMVNQLLGANEIPQIEESDYENLFILEVINSGEPVKLMHLQY